MALFAVSKVSWCDSLSGVRQHRMGVATLWTEACIFDIGKGVFALQTPACEKILCEIKYIHNIHIYVRMYVYLHIIISCINYISIRMFSNTYTSHKQARHQEIYISGWQANTEWINTHFIIWLRCRL